MADVASRLERIFDELLTSEAAVPVRSRSRINCPSWDSLMQLNLILAIEQEFGVSLTDDEAVDLNAFIAALHILEDKLAGRTS